MYDARPYGDDDAATLVMRPKPVDNDVSEEARTSHQEERATTFLLVEAAIIRPTRGTARGNRTVSNVVNQKVQA